jgi:flotillin
MVLVIFVFAVIWASRFRKAGPNEALIVSGRLSPCINPDGTRGVRGFRIVKGGGTFVLPVIERADRLSLELLTLDINTPEMETSNRRRAKVAGKAQIKINGDERSIALAAEHFLSKSPDEIKMAAAQTLENSMRAVLASLTAEDVSQNREAFANRVQESAAQSMSNLGLGLVSFTVRDIRT